jgi:AcrR family transcriptional regulator
MIAVQSRRRLAHGVRQQDEDDADGQHPEADQQHGGDLQQFQNDIPRSTCDVHVYLQDSVVSNVDMRMLTDRMVPPARQLLQERVASGILEGAARTLAEHGTAASMADVAAAAGVARATVYRYFPNRQALLDELTAMALRDADERFQAARLREVPVTEAVARAVRALVEGGDAFVVLVRERAQPDAFDRILLRPLAALLERARTEGYVRADVPVAWLTEALLGLVISVIASSPQRGREDTIAAITSLFLDGARRRGHRLRKE